MLSYQDPASIPQQDMQGLKPAASFSNKWGFHIPIPLKLLFLILPLVCIPIILVGYQSFQTSVESVTKLSRQMQLLQAKNATREINAIFEASFNDLESMTRLIENLLERADSNLSGHDLEDFNTKTGMVLKGFLDNSPYYYRFRYVNENTGRVFTVRQGHGTADAQPIAEEKKIDRSDTDPSEMDILKALGKSLDFYVSPIVRLNGKGPYCIHLSNSVLDAAGQPAGAMIIDLNYSLIMEFVKSIHIGDQGYAFLVDSQGRIIAHPEYQPYKYNLTQYKDPSFLEFIIHILSEKTGWKTFFDHGEKAAAFAQIPATGWALAVTIPIDDFKKEAMNLRFSTMQLVLGMIMISTVIVIFLSFRIIHPIRTLVTATKQVASGDLSREIPVESNDELGVLTHSFNTMIRSLRDIQSELVASEKLISMGRLSAGVAHEIRNPLNAMKGAVTFLQRKRSEDSLVVEYSGIIGEEVERLNEFVTEFLLFARQSDPDKSATDINALIGTVSTLFESGLQDASIQVVEQLDPRLPLVMIDSQQMEQVFLNLFINAGHAMKADGGTLQITTLCRYSGAMKSAGLVPMVRGIRITVSDTGTGIDPENLEWVFDPFYSTKEAGTGLGLPISLSIVENHGGRMKIASTAGIGTTITIDLPVA